MNLVLIAAGGALGALARYGAGIWVQPDDDLFPWGTLAVNVAGSLALGFGFRVLEAAAASAEIRQGLLIGFLGAFTTFSTFSFEAVALIQAGSWTRAGLYVGASVALGLLGVVGGLALAHLAVGR